jgi:hypothetical protein
LQNIWNASLIESHVSNQSYAFGDKLLVLLDFEEINELEEQLFIHDYIILYMLALAQSINRIDA